MVKLFLFLAIFIISVNAVADQDKLKQSSSGLQSPNISSCENVEINYSNDPRDIERINNLLKVNIQLSRTTQLQQKDLSDLRELVGRLSCRLTIRADNENDSDALAAVKVLENAGMVGGAKVDSILKLSYEKILKEFLKNEKKQQQLKFKLAEIAYERASALKMQFKFKDAKYLYEKAIEFDSNNIDFHIGLAKIYYFLGDPRTAVLVLKKAEPLTFKSDPKSRSVFYFCIGWLYQSLGETDTAFYYLHSKADSIVHSKKDSAIVENYNNIGLAWCLKEEYTKAIDYFNRALNIDTTIYGINHPSVAVIYSRLGASWSSINNYDKAIDYFSRALAINTVIYGKKHPDVADIYGGLGEAWDNKGNHVKAIEYYCQALDIDTLVFGNKHPYIAKIYSSLGYAWFLKKVPDKAILYYSHALAIDTIVYGNKHPDVARDYNDLGLAWDLKGDYNKAIASFEQAIKYGLSFWHAEHPEIKDMRANLESSKKKYHTK